ncbi:hypothetical protein KJ678_03585 [Patescibacteria group bacterium]|nr:hypothetical protein [Patescibacteria group bacterium]
MFNLRISSFYAKHKHSIFLIVILFLINLIYILVLFGDAELVAGGDNYTYLQLGNSELNPYAWDPYISLGGRNFSIPNLLGMPLYSYIFSFLSISVLQRVFLFVLNFFSFIAFIKLSKLVSGKLSLFAALPAVMFFSFNAFSALNPISMIPIMYSVYLPLSLYFFIKLVRSEKLDLLNIANLVILSVIFSPINSNPSLSMTIYIPQLLYLFMYFKEFRGKRLGNIILYYILLAIVNAWWLMPMLIYYMEAATRVFKGSWFSALSVGHLYQNFRFIGQWGWYGKHFLHNYYPFNSWYDMPIISFFIYALVIFTIVLSFRKKIGAKKTQNFFIALFLVSLFLIGGSRPPFGFVYNLLFRYFPGFKIFREPFTKFGELYVLSLSVLFYSALLSMEKILRGKRKFFIFVITFLLVTLFAKPILLGEHVWDKWNGSMRSFRVEVPEYWREFEEYQKVNLKDARILTVPKAYYGSAWNWIDGFSSADDVAVNFVSNGNSIIRNPLSAGLMSGEVIDNVFLVKDLPNSYWSLLSVDYILQENDLDWRYSGELTLLPSKNEEFINRLGVEKVKEFGNFTPRSLSKIPNGEPNRSLRNELYTELSDKPSLVLYKVPDVLPKFYIPSKLIYSLSTISDLPYILQISSAPKDVGVFIEVLNKDNKGFLLENANMDTLIFGQRRFSRFSLDKLMWKEGWAWPVVVNMDPQDAKYKLVAYKEKLIRLLPRNPLDKSDILLWFAAKRVAEIAKYSLSFELEEKLISNYTDFISRSMSILKELPEDKRTGEDDNEDDYWGMVGKVLMYVERSNSILPLSDHTFEDKPDPRVLYEDFVKWVYEVATPVCGKYCYSFKVPEDGKYEVYVGGKEISKLVSSGDKLTDLIYTEGGGSINAEKDDWHFEGVSNLKESENYIVNIAFEESENLIGEGEWLVPDSSVLGNASADFVMQNIFPGYYTLGSSVAHLNFVLWEKTLHYRPVTDFEGGVSYRLSFEYSSDSGGLGVALVESNASIPENVSKSQLLSTKMLVKAEFGQTCLDKSRESDCWRRYSQVVRASNNAKSALFYMYAYPNVGKISSVNVRDIKVEKVLEPLLVVKRDKGAFVSETTSDYTKPNVQFTKINPTKYHVNITDANTSYDLIFSESYDSGWKLYLDGTKSIADSSHYIVNGYANLWHINPEDVENRDSYELVVEFFPQRIFLICVYLGIATFMICVLYGLSHVVRKIKYGRNS